VLGSKPEPVFNGRIPAFASCGHACCIGLGRLAAKATELLYRYEMTRCAKSGLCG
jgi:hypothetical protein